MTTETYTRTFYEALRDGASRSAGVIVPIVCDLLHPMSVVDVGCGDGTWLATFRDFSFGQILGVDGEHVKGELQISEDEFRALDLSRPFAIERTFDLALSLEVAEHLPPASASEFVASLTRLAPAVLFSAAIPFQGGVHHVNEQWPDHWASLFRQRGYFCLDCIRKRVWENESVDWWYTQNMLLFISSTLLESNAVLRRELENTNPEQLRLVHPRNYTEAMTPVETQPWSVASSFRLLSLCFRRALQRRFYSIMGKNRHPEIPQNPPNLNSALENSTYYGICKRPGRE